MAHWENWARNQQSDARVVEPADLRSLKHVVRRAAADGGRMRASGSRLSWTRLVPVDHGGTIISTTKLNRVLAVDRRRRTVTVECGVTIDALTQALRQKGLTLFSPTLHPGPTIGGVIATGAHGTNMSVGNFSDQILEMTIIDHEGNERVVRQGSPDFPAAQVALGTLGIVYSIKLEVEEEFPVYVDERWVPVRYVLEELDDLVGSYEFIEVFWYPLQDHVWLFLMHRAKPPQDKPTLIGRTTSKLRDTFEERIGEHLLPLVARRAPGFTPVLSWVADSLSREVHQRVVPASDAFHFQRGYVKCFDIDYAVPAKDGARAWRDAIDLVHEYALAHLYPLNLAIHCRFTGGSRAWLAPDHGLQNWCHIEASTARETSLWKEFFDELEERWRAIPGSRPHWAKLFSRTDGLARRYPNWKRFLTVRQKWDPGRLFLNEYLEKEIFRLR
jgi:FAD/FMN-containing dehydrogenase